MTMDVRLTYRPARYTAAEIAEFRKHRAKTGPDYRLCQNNNVFRVKSRTMRRVMVGITVDNDIFLLFNVEYGWHSKPKGADNLKGHIEIVSTELIEINEMQPSADEILRYRNSFKDSEEFKRNLVEADYYKYA